MTTWKCVWKGPFQTMDRPTKSQTPETNEQAAEQANHSAIKSRSLQWLGLAVKARKAALGADAVMKSIQTKEAHVVVVATDTGKNMAKKYRDKCAFYHIPLAVCFTRFELGLACGKAHTVAVALTDPGFAAKMITFIGEYSGGEAFGETSSV